MRTLIMRGREMDLARFLTVAGEALRDIDDSVIIGDSSVVASWLSMDDIGAICAIKTWVYSAPAEDTGRVDAALLAMASNHADPAARARLVKFYAMFKIVELLRYEKFRGFPD